MSRHIQYRLVFAVSINTTPLVRMPFQKNLRHIDTEHQLKYSILSYKRILLSRIYTTI